MEIRMSHKLSEADMDVEPFLHPRQQRTIALHLDHVQRHAYRRELGAELVGDTDGPRGSFTDTFFDFEHRAVKTDDLLQDDRTWTVVDTAFGCRYLTLADYKGGFILMSLLPGVYDVLVEFDRPVPNDHPSRHDDNYYNPVPERNRLQYIAFLSIANGLVAESERHSRS